jgi:hypothetical protein
VPAISTCADAGVIDEIAGELVDGMGSGFKLLPKEADPDGQADATE